MHSYGDAANDQRLDLMRQAFKRLDAARDRAKEELDKANSLWAGVIGASSALEAAKSNYAATDKLVWIMADKLDRYGKQFSVSADEADAFIRDCGKYANVSDIIETARALRLATAAQEVAGGTGRSLAPWGIGLAVLAGAYLFLRR